MMEETPAHTEEHLERRSATGRTTNYHAEVAALSKVSEDLIRERRRWQEDGERRSLGVS